jgi:hypothetical protein
MRSSGMSIVVQGEVMYSLFRMTGAPVPTMTVGRSNVDCAGLEDGAQQQGPERLE